jgi:hypothetical protein
MKARFHIMLPAALFFLFNLCDFGTVSRAAVTAYTDNITPSQEARTSNDVRSSKTGYTVQQGDCLGKILREAFKLPEAVIFSSQTTLSMQAANPHIPNLNALQPGEKLFVPSDIQQYVPIKTVVADENKHISPSAPQKTSPPEVLQKIKQNGRIQPATGYHGNTLNDAQSAPAIHIATDETTIKENSLAGTDALLQEKQIRHMLIDFVHAFGGYDNTSCVKTLPIENGGTIVMDCSKFPVYEFPWGARIILDYGDCLPSTVGTIIAAQWDHTKIITAGYNENAETIFSRVIDGCGLHKNESGNRYTVSRDNIQISLSGNWIVYRDQSQKNIFVITITNDVRPRVPESLQEYLTGLGINLLHLSPAEKQPDVKADHITPAHKEVVSLQADPVRMTDMILELIGIKFQKNVKTKFTPHNARGITFEVTIDRKFELAGKTRFIDFKNLSSNIASMLNNNGSKILQIDLKTNDYFDLIHELIDFCTVQNSSSPAHFQFDQSGNAWIEVSIPGFLLHTKYGDFLLSNIEIHKNIFNLLSEIDINIIKF